MSNTPGLDATTGETWWRETAGLWLERARIAERERDEAIGLLREITEEIDFEARPPYRHDLYLAATAFLARVGKEQK